MICLEADPPLLTNRCCLGRGNDLTVDIAVFDMLKYIILYTGGTIGNNRK